MHFETSTECNTDKIKDDTTKIFQVIHFQRKNYKMHFETSAVCKTDKINHDTALKIFQVIRFQRKNSKIHFETSTECNTDKINHDNNTTKIFKVIQFNEDIP
jgi:hypothetical protein